MHARLMICWLLLSPLCIGAQTEKKKTGLLPHHAKLQYAGSIGFLSIGVGYEFAKKKLQADVYYGYVPESIGGVNIHSVTGKLTWLPLSIERNKYTYSLLTAGFLVNYAFGKQYDFSLEDFDYYGFPTAAHIGLFVGGGITRNRLGLYYELGSTDRDLVSFVNNTKGIRFDEIIHIGFGARLSFR